MSLLTDRKYLSQVSNRLPLFKETSRQPYHATFRCPFCGDSKKSQTKTRGHIYENKGSLWFKCFNCDVPYHSMYKFLYNLDSSLAKEYVTDSFLEKKQFENIEVKKKEPEKVRVDIAGLKKITKLGPDHEAIKYIASRRIPVENLKDLYYTDNFNSWVNSIIPMKLKEDFDEPRIVIPFFDKDRKLFGVTGRSLKKDGLRYITIMFDENEKKVFGLDRVNFSKKYYVLEGAFDSFFVKNSIAMAGADLDLNSLPNKKNAVVVLDNEPRNKEIHKRMEKVIKLGFPLCIWPKNIQEKDVNNMILAGYEDIEKIIDNNTYTGLKAELALIQWKKIR